MSSSFGQTLFMVIVYYVLLQVPGAKYLRLSARRHPWVFPWPLPWRITGGRLADGIYLMILSESMLFFLSFPATWQDFLIHVEIPILGRTYACSSR